MDKAPPRGPACEDPHPDPAHRHFSPLSLALELDELDEERFSEIELQLIECDECLGGLEELVCWLEVLDHWDPRVGPEYLTRHQLMAELLFTAGAHRERLARLGSDDTFHSWGLCRLLLEESRQLGLRTRPSLRIAEMTQTIAEALDPDFYGPELVADLRAEAAAHLAVLRRSRRCFEESGSLFRLAREHLAAGTGRAAVARTVKGYHSLFISDNQRLGLPQEPWDSPDPSTLELQEDDLPRPVHELLERCTAAPEDG